MPEVDEHHREKPSVLKKVKAKAKKIKDTLKKHGHGHTHDHEHDDDYHHDVHIPDDHDLDEEDEEIDEDPEVHGAPSICCFLQFLSLSFKNFLPLSVLDLLCMLLELWFFFFKM